MTDSAEPQGEIEELRRRLAVLEGSPEKRPRRRAKSFLSALLILRACVLTPPAENPAVRAAVTDRVTTAIMQYLPVGSLLDDVAPADRPALDAAIGKASSALTSGLTGFVHSQVEKVVNSDAFITIWVTVNKDAHAAVDRLLTGEGGGAVQIKGDSVTLDLAPLIDQVKTRLVANGLGVASHLPEVHTDHTLIESHSIKKAQTGFRVLQLIGFWLPVITVLIAAAGVLLAARRRRALVTVALGMAAGAVRQTARKAGLRLGPVGRFIHRWKACIGWALVGGAVLIFLLWSYPSGMVVFWIAVGPAVAPAVLEFLDDRPETGTA